MADETAEQCRARILALQPEDRAFLARIIRKQLDRIPVLPRIAAGINCQSSPDCPEYAQNKACQQGPPAYAPYSTAQAAVDSATLPDPAGMPSYGATRDLWGDGEVDRG